MDYDYENQIVSQKSDRHVDEDSRSISLASRKSDRRMEEDNRSLVSRRSARRMEEDKRKSSNSHRLSQFLKTGFIPFSSAKKRVSPLSPNIRRSIFPKKRTHFVERKIGYGDLDDWNALPPEDQARIRGHSKSLLKSFNKTKWFLQTLGRFPFKSKSLEDGSYTFTYNRFSFTYILFFLTTMAIVVIFVLFSAGAFAIYIDIDSGTTYHDRCGKSWGQSIMARNLPMIIYIWSQMGLTAAGSIYILTHGISFLEFYNVVNEAAMQLDVDPTDGIFYSDLRSNIVFGTLFFGGIVLFIWTRPEILDEVSAFTVQAICYFFWKDMYTVGSKNVFTVQDYADLKPKCDGVCKGCYERHDDMDYAPCHDAKNECYNLLNDQTPEYQLIELIGFVIICYSLLGAKALIRQLEFFCAILVNLASTWNKRFLNYASSTIDNKIHMEDPYRRRITDTCLLKDHYQIVRLYNSTEGNFSFILFCYYASVFFNLICQFYYIALLNSQVTCATAAQREIDAAEKGLCYVDINGTINNTMDVLQAGLNNAGGLPVVSFEDACVYQKGIIRNAAKVTTVLLMVTLTSFVITTVEADKASHQADIGFYRVRKRGYMSCRTKRDRNFMHSLVFSFTGPKPFVITAAGYFPIRKKTIIVLVSCAFIYFLIILSFKPGMTTPNVRCYKKDSDGREEFVVKYPKI